MIKVILNNPRRYPVSRRRVNQLAKKAGEIEKKIKGTVELTIVNNAEIKKINSEWRNINRPTDVLSFAWQEEGRIEGRLLGQIFISYPRIIIQAEEYGVTAAEEFARMLVHGLLHLAGHEHKKKLSEKRMFALQENIIKAVK
jgi:probable rRNA maturation factor